MQSSAVVVRMEYGRVTGREQPSRGGGASNVQWFHATAVPAVQVSLCGQSSAVGRRHSGLFFNIPYVAVAACIVVITVSGPDVLVPVACYVARLVTGGRRGA